MGHMEYYIFNLYEHKKRQCGIKLGIDLFTPSQKKWAIALLLALIACSFLMVVLIFLYPYDFWFLCGLIPCVALLIILFAMDAKDRKLHMGQHVEEYNKRINLLQKILVEEFSIDTKDKLSLVITKFQKYLDEQAKQEQKMNKIAITALTSFGGVLTTSLANLNSIGINFSDWLTIVVLLLLLVGMASILIYATFYFAKNLNSKKDKYTTMINDLEYIQLSKYQ